MFFYEGFAGRSFILKLPGSISAHIIALLVLNGGHFEC